MSVIAFTRNQNVGKSNSKATIWARGGNMFVHLTGMIDFPVSRKSDGKFLKNVKSHTMLCLPSPAPAGFTFRWIYTDLYAYICGKAEATYSYILKQARVYIPGSRELFSKT